VVQLLVERYAIRNPIIGVDLSEHEVAIAKEQVRFPNVRFVHGRAQDVEQIATHCSAVIMSGLFQQIPREERGSLLRACHRALGAGGTLLFNTHFYRGAVPEDASYFYVRWLREAGKELRACGLSVNLDRPKPIGLQTLTLDEHRTMLMDAGFQNIQIEQKSYEMSLPDWDAISGYSVFIQGALGIDDVSVGKDALRIGLRRAFDALGLKSVRRNWLFARAVK